MSVQEDVISSTPTPETFEEFVVEKIVGKKFENGEVLYKIQWQGFEGQDTWEPENHILDCPELIRDWEQSERDKREGEEEDTSNQVIRVSINEMEEETSLSRVGFERGLEPQKILGATNCEGELCFLMKWKGSDVTDIVPREEANAKCPQVVIRFYEDRIMWNTRSRSLEEMFETNIPD